MNIVKKGRVANKIRYKNCNRLNLIIEKQSVQIKAILEEVDNLKEEVRILSEENSELKKELATVRLDNDRLRNRVKELEAQNNQDSHNSSKPPSSDGYKKKIFNNRKKSGKPVGGQTGHEGCTLALYEEVDEVIEYRVKECENCGCSLEDIEISDYVKHQIIDIPEIKMEVKEHRGEIKVCPRCGLENIAEVPYGSKGKVEYGDRIKSLTVYQMDYNFIPYERMSEFTEDICKHKISQGTLKNFKQECHNLLSSYEEIVREKLKKSEVINCDESGVHCNGHRDWLHSVSTPELTYYDIEAKRDKTSMDNVGILPDYNGTVVHDHWKSYFKYGCKHSLCNAHHLRELTFAYEEDSQQWAHMMIDLLLKINSSVELAKSEGNNSLPQEVISRYENEYNEIIQEGLKLYPCVQITNPTKKRGRKKQSKSKNLLDRLNEYRRETLAFMYDFKVPFDNNQAERDIRMVKLKQKISGGFRSDNGADVFCRIRGYISTVKKQGLNVLSAIKNVFSGKPFIPASAGVHG
jgi:transposase